MSKLTDAKRLYHKRQELEARAKHDYVKAQEQYEKARAVDLHPRERLRNAADKAKSYWRKRVRLTRSAKKSYQQEKARKSLALHPERTAYSPCKSSRNGVRPRLIVLHITVSHNRPGLSDLDGICAYFGHLSTEASSHIVNDAEGHDARVVRDEDKAWTQAAYNPQSLSIEQIEYADKPRERWLTENRKQLENTANWIAYWSHKYGIPIKRSITHGVCQHRDLGAAGGGHTDVGPGYPIGWVLARALEIRKAKYGH